MTQKRGLGTGLDDMGLSGGLNELLSSPVASQEPMPGDKLAEVFIKDLQPGRYQPRRHFDETALQELADSISVQGVIQPIVARSIGAGQFEIIAGERRWRAAQMAGLDKIPAVIRDMNDETAMAVALIENLQRQDLNVVEEAQAMQRLIEDFGLTHEEVGRTVGKSRTSVTNLLRLLSLQPEVKRMLENGELDMGHARALLALNDHRQTYVAKTVVAKSSTVRETEAMVKKVLAGQSHTASKSTARQASIDPDIKRLQMSLSDTLGATVKIQHSSSGKGKLIIHYAGLNELDGILEHIQAG